MAKFNPEKFEASVIKAARDGLKKAARAVFNKMVDNTIKTDHTLEDLRKLGHPYSSAHPIKLEGHKDFELHRQSGTLFDNLRIVQEDPDTIAIGVDPANVPYLDAVILGTRKMVARDFPTESYNEAKPEIKAAMDSSLNKIK